LGYLSYWGYSGYQSYWGSLNCYNYRGSSVCYSYWGYLGYHSIYGDSGVMEHGQEQTHGYLNTVQLHSFEGTRLQDRRTGGKIRIKK
jgi:hypothetical protein